jgi:hypothetical protein
MEYNNNNISQEKIPQYAISAGINSTFPSFLKGILSPVEYFLDAYAIKSVLSVRAHMVSNF